MNNYFAAVIAVAVMGVCFVAKYIFVYAALAFGLSAFLVAKIKFWVFVSACVALAYLLLRIALQLILVPARITA